MKRTSKVSAAYSLKGTLRGELVVHAPETEIADDDERRETVFRLAVSIIIRLIRLAINVAMTQESGHRAPKAAASEPLTPTFHFIYSRHVAITSGLALCARRQMTSRVLGTRGSDSEEISFYARLRIDFSVENESDVTVYRNGCISVAWQLSRIRVNSFIRIPETIVYGTRASRRFPVAFANTTWSYRVNTWHRTATR